MLPRIGCDKQDSHPSDFVCFSIFDWWYHSHAHSDFQLMLRLARTRRVLFVNSIGMRMPALGRTPRAARRIVRKLASIARSLRRPVPELPTFWVFSPLSFPVYRSPTLRSLNAHFVRAQIAVARWLLGLHDPVAFVTVPTAWEVIRKTSYRQVLYNRSDKHSAFEEADHSHIRSLELELLQRADRVVYANSGLLESERSLTGERALYLGHGVEAEQFRGPFPEPTELGSIPRPRIGFYGDLRGRVIDFELLARVADAHPDVQLVLIGDASDEIADLVQRKNVHWLGYRDHERIAPYGAALDVALMPYRDTDWVRGIQPIKLLELFALGIPIVGTDFPALRAHASRVRVASSREDFVRQVSDALERGDPPARREERRALASRSSWDSKLQDLLRACGIS